jgi:hypothetical protein
LIYDGDELLIVAAESVLKRASEYYAGTTHQIALQTFLAENGMAQNSRFNFLIGFWVSKQERCVRSCANYFYQRSREMTNEMEESMHDLVFPVIDDYFEHNTTFCIGVTKKGKNCRRLVASGRHCHWHVP